MPVRAESEARLLEACISVLSLDAIGGLQKLLTPEAIQEATRTAPGAQGVSRHTAYRRWPDRGQAVVDVANFLADPEANGSLGMFSAALRARATDQRDRELEPLRRAPTDPEAARESGLVGFRSAMGASLELQLGSPGLVANWVLHAAATTSSLVWRGHRPDTANEAIGRQVLAARAASHDEIVERWSYPLRRALSAWGRRPRPGFTVEAITQLVLNMYLGCLHEIFGDSRLNDDTLDEEDRRTRLKEMIDVACEAMFEIAWAFTEPGSLADPRRPMYDIGNETPEMFDRVVDAAAQLYADADAGTVGPASAAELVNVPAQVASVLFPTPGDLADSVLRRLVAGSSEIMGQSTKASPVLMIGTLLMRLSQAAELRPALIRAAQSHAPTHPPDATPLLDELGKGIADALQSPRLTCREPSKTAERLISFTLGGNSGWPAVEAILDILDAFGPPPKSAQP